MHRLTESRSVKATTALLLALIWMAVACSAAGAAIPTNDPDWTWQNPLPQGGDILALTSTGEGDVWTAGPPAHALHTTDAGRSWSAVSAFSVFGASDIMFVDALHGRAVGTDTLGPGTCAAIFYEPTMGASPGRPRR